MSSSVCGHILQIEQDTDEHLPVVNSIGVLEEVKESRDGRILHVEGEPSAAVLEFLDGLCVIGVFLEGRVQDPDGHVLRLHDTPFGTWRRTWT